jgi:hypothetical protein
MTEAGHPTPDSRGHSRRQGTSRYGGLSASRARLRAKSRAGSSAPALVHVRSLADTLRRARIRSHACRRLDLGRHLGGERLHPLQRRERQHDAEARRPPGRRSDRGGGIPGAEVAPDLVGPRKKPWVPRGCATWRRHRPHPPVAPASTTAPISGRHWRHRPVQRRHRIRHGHDRRRRQRRHVVEVRTRRAHARQVAIVRQRDPGRSLRGHRPAQPIRRSQSAGTRGSG